MTNRSGDLKEIKMYSDYKSPYAYLAFDPAFALADRYRVRLRWIPFQLRLKGKGDRSVYSEYKVRYSYLDARRWANRRGGIVLKGPLKIYDSTPQSQRLGEALEKSLGQHERAVEATRRLRDLDRPRRRVDGDCLIGLR